MVCVILKHLKWIAKLSFRIFFFLIHLPIKMYKNSQTWTYPVEFEG